MPHRQEVRDTAGELYEKIQKKIDEGEWAIDDELKSEILISEKKEGDLIFFDLTSLVDLKPKNWGANVNTWMSKKLNKVYEPIFEWIEDEYDTELYFFDDGGGHTKLTTDGEQPYEWSSTEIDFQLYEYIQDIYPDVEGKRDFKNKVTDWFSEKLKTLTMESSDDVKEVIEEEHSKEES